MYNQYFQTHTFAPIEYDGHSSCPVSEKDPSGKISPGSSQHTAAQKNTVFSGLFPHGLPDTGDILLILIALLLFLDGDNLELVITLGLMLLLGLGDR